MPASTNEPCRVRRKLEVAHRQLPAVHLHAQRGDVGLETLLVAFLARTLVGEDGAILLADLHQDPFVEEDLVVGGVVRPRAKSTVDLASARFIVLVLATGEGRDDQRIIQLWYPRISASRRATKVNQAGSSGGFLYAALCQAPTFETAVIDRRYCRIKAFGGGEFRWTRSTHAQGVRLTP